MVAGRGGDRRGRLQRAPCRTRGRDLGGGDRGRSRHGVRDALPAAAHRRPGPRARDPGAAGGARGAAPDRARGARPGGPLAQRDDAAPDRGAPRGRGRRRAAGRRRPDLEDAIAALRDAERVGRQAMADIRSTVGTARRGSRRRRDRADRRARGPARPWWRTSGAPGSTSAYDAQGDLAQVPATTALGLYRIVQESLANVAKHAPGSRVQVRLDVARDPGELVVTSELPRGVRRNAGGSGLSGMAERAAQLGARFSAGPVDRSGWSGWSCLEATSPPTATSARCPGCRAPFRRDRRGEPRAASRPTTG